METHKRGSDGWRLFSPAFKREQIERVLSGELTMAELSRELSVSPTVIRRWKQLVDHGSTAAVAANDDVVPVSELRAGQRRIRVFERLVGKKAMEIEIFQASREEVKKKAALVRRIHATAWSDRHRSQGANPREDRGPAQS